MSLQTHKGEKTKNKKNYFVIDKRLLGSLIKVGFAKIYKTLQKSELWLKCKR